MKQVSELADSSAWVVLNRKGEEVATVQQRHGSGGGVQVDVWSRKPGEKHLSLTHQRKAGGGGYDKAAAALAGAVIEGYQLANHCGHVEPKGEAQRKRLMAAYQANPNNSQEWEKKARKLGMHFANCVKGDSGEWVYTSLFFQTGLRRLEELGFRVIQAL